MTNAPRKDIAASVRGLLLLRRTRLESDRR